MALEPEFEKYLRAERESLRQQIKLLFDHAARIDALLGQSSISGSAGEWRVTEEPADPFKALGTWPLTSRTTFGRCREALHRFGREATAQEIKALIKHQFGEEPAKSIIEMLRKRSADERSGVYRVTSKGNPAKYGLTIWKTTGKSNTDGSYSAADEDEIVPGY
jgi:hypothetical protein